jgi:hypothetical protein
MKTHKLPQLAAFVVAVTFLTLLPGLTGRSKTEPKLSLTAIPGINPKAAQDLQDVLAALSNPAILPDESRYMLATTEDERWTYVAWGMCTSLPKSPDDFRPGYHASLQFMDGAWGVAFTKVLPKAT